MNLIEKRLLSLIEKKYNIELFTLISRQIVYTYLDRYLDAREDITYTKKRDVEKSIWMYWNSEEKIPKIIRQCMESVKRNTDRNVIVLSENNLNEYVELPEYILKKYKSGIISKTHFSDIIRVALLSIYGGTWIDATVFCTDKIPQEYLDADLFMFQRGPWVMYGFEQLIRCSSWFMTAKEGHPLIVQIRNVLYAYWKDEMQLKDYFILHILFGRLVDYKREYLYAWQNMPFADTQHPHYLNSILNKEYSEKGWEYAKTVSPIHKLSYKRKIIDSRSYYKMIMNGTAEMTL